MWDKSKKLFCNLHTVSDHLSWEVGWTWRTFIPLATHQFPRSPHIFCAFCRVLSLLLLWTVLLGPHQDLRLLRLAVWGWNEQPLNEVVEALARTFLFNSFFFFIMMQVFTIPFPPVCDLCSVNQIFASRWLDTLQTWLELSSHLFEYLNELPGIFFWVRCFQFHAPAFQLLPSIHSEHALYLPILRWSGKFLLRPRARPSLPDSRQYLAGLGGFWWRMG